MSEVGRRYAHDLGDRRLRDLFLQEHSDLNLLAIKLNKARFVRFISGSGLELARSLANVEGPASRLRVIHMGVDLPPCAPESPPAADPFVILCPANLLPVKGHRYLIEAVALLKKRGVEVFLCLAGQGELREELRKQVDSLGLSGHVWFLDPKRDIKIFVVP